MKQFTVSQSHSVPDDIHSVAVDCFGGEARRIKEGLYKVTETEDPLITEVIIHVTEDNENVYLTIETKDLDEAQRENIVNRVPDAISAKNMFLEIVTGKNVEDRKREMYEEVLPTNSQYIKTPYA